MPPVHPVSTGQAPGVNCRPDKAEKGAQRKRPAEQEEVQLVLKLQQSMHSRLSRPARGVLRLVVMGLTRRLTTKALLSPGSAACTSWPRRALPIESQLGSQPGPCKGAINSAAFQARSIPTDRSGQPKRLALATFAYHMAPQVVAKLVGHDARHCRLPGAALVPKHTHQPCTQQPWRTYKSANKHLQAG